MIMVCRRRQWLRKWGQRWWQPQRSRMLFWLLVLSPVFAHGVPAQWSVTSSPEQARLVEVFTSQGCSSCPPADRWLSTFRDHKGLWQRIVPVAYHVTYWDYLGWRDPFANAEHDQRQRQIAAAAGAGVYTPGVFLDRQEWRGWRRRALSDAQLQGPQVGVLALQGTGSQVAVTLTPRAAITLQAATVNIALLQVAQSTDIGAGENRGERLLHDFVAGPVTRLPLQRQQPDASGVAAWTAAGVLVPQNQATAGAVAIWVVERDGTVIQATGGWLN